MAVSAKETVDQFLRTPSYIVTVMLLAALSNLFGWELPVYTVFIAVGIYACLWGKDLLPLIPLFLSAYIAPSMHNNPGRNPDSVFALHRYGIYFGFLVAALVIALAVRIIRQRKLFFTRKCQLLPGLLALAITYLLSGIGSDGYAQLAPKSILFALLQGTCLLLPYWLISCGVDWSRTRRDYLAWTGFAAGGVLLCQILWVYFSTEVVVDGIIERTNIYTGWGMYNNMGCLLAMMIPFAFYLATKYRKGWIGTVVGTAFLIGVVLTCSRGSILVGAAVYVFCTIAMLRYANNRRANFIALVTSVVAVLLITLLFHKQLLLLFSTLLDKALDPSTRDIIYRDGLRLFRENPIFGITFYPPAGVSWGWSTVPGFTAFFPPRFHNTFVQLLASCGILGFGAYLWHRVQMVKLFLQRGTKEALFNGCCVLVLLICSMLDCHLFNFGPALFYAVILACTENCPIKK